MDGERGGRDAGGGRDASTSGGACTSGAAETGGAGGTGAGVRIGAEATPRPAALRFIAAGWTYLRAVSGDDAYERYLAHHAVEHAGQAPMSRKDYFNERQRQKWTGVTRCC
jgi:uncharacterized short protein YbdD (DUF466 family)